MNKKINLPFSKINLINCSQKQFDFLSGYFFKVQFDTQIFFEINVKFEKINLPSHYKQIEKDTYIDQDNLYLSDTKKRLCQISSLIDDQLTLSCDQDFDLYYLFSFILEPLLIINLINHEVIFIHSSAVTKNNKAILFPAWRNTGKTETILKLSQKSEYRFMSDDYVVLYKDKAYSFPKKINLFSYNLNEELLKKLPKIEVFKLQFFMMIKVTLERLSYIVPGKSLAKVFFRVSELAEIATNFKIYPKKLGMNFSQSEKIGVFNIIQKANYTFKNKLSNVDAAKLMGIVIGYELNDFFKITDKLNFSYSKINFDKSQFIEKYNKSLAGLLETKKIFLKNV